MAKSSNIEKPTARPAVAPFDYNGVSITYDSNGLVNLTAMWKATGGEESKQPKQWRRFEGASFIAHRASVEKVSVSHLLRAEKGRNGSTWAHWQIALAYAKYLSNEFHSFVNEAFKEWVEEKADPGLKLDRAIDGYIAKGKTPEWSLRRAKGITTRKALCSTMQEHNCKIKGSDNPYAEATKTLVLEVLKKTPSKIREERGLTKSDAARDTYDEEELMSIEWAEMQARKRIVATGANGNEACVEAARMAGHAVGIARQYLAATQVRRRPIASPAPSTYDETRPDHSGRAASFGGTGHAYPWNRWSGRPGNRRMRIARPAANRSGNDCAKSAV